MVTQLVNAATGETLTATKTQLPFNLYLIVCMYMYQSRLTESTESVLPKLVLQFKIFYSSGKLDRFTYCTCIGMEACRNNGGIVRKYLISFLMMFYNCGKRQKTRSETNFMLGKTNCNQRPFSSL